MLSKYLVPRKQVHDLSRAEAGPSLNPSPQAQNPGPSSNQLSNMLENLWEVRCRETDESGLKLSCL